MRNNYSFYCFICDKAIEGNQTSYKHFETHILHEPFQCLDCRFQCHNESQLQEHLEESNHLNYQKKTKLGLRKFIDSLESFSRQLENIDDKDIVKINLEIKKVKGVSQTGRSSRIESCTWGKKHLIYQMNMLLEKILIISHFYVDKKVLMIVRG
uniref:C2H2-type domain-containing protein n=1 Tax=Strongyloides venezuelensis TaxID=75913 RepID=A0A0K0F3H9_STRVS